MCCKEMFKKWLETQPKANWGQLIDALREVELTDVAELLRRRLSGEQFQNMFATWVFTINCIHHHTIFLVLYAFLHRKTANWQDV